MFNRLSSCITAKLVSKGAISSDEFELYHYGLFIILTESFLGIYCLVTGVLLAIPLESFVFYFVFMLVHRVSGGYHAKTELQCQIVTLISFLLCIIGIKALQGVPLSLLFVLYAICLVVLGCIAPADTPEKPLDKEEKAKFRKLTVMVILILLLIIVIMVVLKIKKTWINSIVFSTILETISVTMGRILNHKTSNAKSVP
jgi:accessory gene regulator B